MGFDITSLIKVDKLIDLVKKGMTLEAQEEIMNYRQAILSLDEENHELRRKLRELEDTLRLKRNMHFRDYAYFRIEEDDDKIDGPFCQRCFDVDGKCVRLVAAGNPKYRTCPECKNHFNTAT